MRACCWRKRRGLMPSAEEVPLLLNSQRVATPGEYIADRGPMPIRRARRSASVGVTPFLLNGGRESFRPGVRSVDERLNGERMTTIHVNSRSSCCRHCFKLICNAESWPLPNGSSPAQLKQCVARARH